MPVSGGAKGREREELWNAGLEIEGMRGSLGLPSLCPFPLPDFFVKTSDVIPPHPLI